MPTLLFQARTGTRCYRKMSFTPQAVPGPHQWCWCKKDGSTCFCIDYREVNAISRKDAYTFPRVDDTLDTLAESKWFSTLISGYWQVEVSPEDQEKTALCTLEGLFEFKVMPFGLCNAPATF